MDQDNQDQHQKQQSGEDKHKKGYFGLFKPRSTNSKNQNSSDLKTVGEDAVSFDTKSSSSSDYTTKPKTPDPPKGVKGIVIPNLAESVRAAEQSRAMEMKSQYTKFFDKSNIGNDKEKPSTEKVDPSSAGFVAPAAWSRRKITSHVVTRIPATLTDAVSSSTLNDSMSGIDKADIKKWEIRIFKPDSSLYRIVSHELATCPQSVIKCALSTTVTELINQLGKRLLIEDISRYGLYFVNQYSKRLLAPVERPMEIQITFLEDIGYRADFDKLERTSITDMHWYFLFVFREMSFIKLGPTETNDLLAKDPLNIDLSGLDLDLLPIKFFEAKYSSVIETLDVSSNVRLDLNDDFFQGCTSLVKLIVNRNELTSVPEGIAKAGSLRHISLHHNHLVSNGLDPLITLTNLVHLDLSCNDLTTFPNTLGSLCALKTLNISNNQFTSLGDGIGLLQNLGSLDASFNQISHLTAAIGYCRQLSELYLACNLLASLPPQLSNCPIMRLDIRTNQFADLSSLRLCTSLSHLLADFNVISRVGDQFSAPELRECSLMRNSISKFELAFQSRFMVTLNLSGSKMSELSDLVFSNCTRLEQLILDNNHLRVLPSSIGLLVNLRHFSVHSNKVKEIPSSMKNLPNLQLLNLYGNNFFSLPSDIWRFPNLRVLNISSNSLRSFPPPDVSPNGDSDDKNLPLAKTLQELYIGENRLNDDALDTLSLLVNLRILNLAFNELVDVGAAISSLVELRELYLSGNQLTNVPDDLDKCKLLKILYINSNKFVSLPAELGKIPTLAVLDASCNALKYNVTNWPYDWNWNWNTELNVLDLSGNHKLDIKSKEIKEEAPSTIISKRRKATVLAPDVTIKQEEENKNLTDFTCLSQLKLLDLTDIRTLPQEVPQETGNLRVRAGVVEGESKYGLAVTLGEKMEPWLSYEVVEHRFLDSDNDHLWGLFEGKSTTSLAKYLHGSFGFSLGSELKKSPNEDVAQLLRRTFLNLMKEYAYVHPKEINGSTCAVAFIRDSTLYVANVGDVMAVVSKNGSAKCLTTKHHSWLKEETSRIRTLGGSIDSKGLVEGKVPFTRAFGFFNLLPYVNCAPSVSSYAVTDDDDFLIIASDTFWQCMSYQSAVDIARTEKINLNAAAKKLRDVAISYGARTSMTVLVLSLHPSLAPRRENKERKRRVTADVTDRTLDRYEKEVAPPQGKVALVFSDIKDSTRLWEEYQHSMRAALDIHHMIVRRALRTTGGYEVKTEGDAFVVAFDSVVLAVRFCLSVQSDLMEGEWPQDILEDSGIKPVIDPNGNCVHRGLSVRMGIHFGVPICEQDPTTRRMDYLGSVVNKTSRICSAADGGQVFLSVDAYDSYQEAPDRELADNLDPSFFEVGERKLKGFDSPEFLYAVYPKPLSYRHSLMTTDATMLSAPSNIINASLLSPVPSDEKETEFSSEVPLPPPLQQQNVNIPATIQEIQPLKEPSIQTEWINQLEAISDRLTNLTFQRFPHVQGNVMNAWVPPLQTSNQDELRLEAAVNRIQSLIGFYDILDEIGPDMFQDLDCGFRMHDPERILSVWRRI